MQTPQQNSAAPKLPDNVLDRRQMISRGLVAGAACSLSHLASTSQATAASQTQVEIQTELPQGRVPLSFIIDDSTCLVNMGKFCMPQFAATYPQRQNYKRPWRDWPDEIPDDFVREFADWCSEHGVKGKYSIVPYPACVGWLDRELPGWSQQQLRQSLRLVRDHMLDNWDIHPEMITHTRVIDLKSGRPFADFSPAHMENSYPQEDVSVDYLAEYLAYALRILRNCELPCEGITTPGGFGNRVKEKLPVAVGEAVRDVFGCELPHYFKYIAEPNESTAPRMEATSELDSDTPQVVMNVLAGTGDWYGGWDGFETCEEDRYCNPDATSGRMVELIEKQQPAVMLCHWPGLYCNGMRQGYDAFMRVVTALESRYSDSTLWMKASELARYWASRELTKIEYGGGIIDLKAPFACENFTLSINSSCRQILFRASGVQSPLKEVADRKLLSTGTFYTTEARTMICIDLNKGLNQLIPQWAL